MMRPLSMLALIVALSLPAGRLVAQDAMKRNVPDSLVSKAKISEDFSPRGRAETRSRHRAERRARTCTPPAAV